MKKKGKREKPADTIHHLPGGKKRGEKGKKGGKGRGD